MAGPDSVVGRQAQLSAVSILSASVRVLGPWWCVMRSLGLLEPLGVLACQHGLHAAGGPRAPSPRRGDALSG